VKEQFAKMYLAQAPGINNLNITPRTRAMLRQGRNPLSLAPNLENDLKEQIGRMHLAEAPGINNFSPRTKAFLRGEPVPEQPERPERPEPRPVPQRRSRKKFRIGSIPKHIGRLFGFTKKR